LFPFTKSKQQGGYVGLEVRPDGLALAILRSKKDDPSAGLEYRYEPCSAAEREDVLKKMVAEFGLSGMACRAVLPVDQYKTYPIDKPEVEDSELSDAARWRVKDLLEFDLEDAVTDVYDFPADGLRGGRLPQLNVVVCRKAIVESMVALVSSSEMELKSIDIADLSLRNIALQQNQETDRSIALLYLRRGAGNMVFVKNEELYLARHFEFSVDALTDPAQQESVIQYLALEIQRSFDYFESQLGQIPPKEITLFGPDPSIPLANMLGGSISAKLSPLVLPNIPDDSSIELINSLVAVGATLRGGDS